MQGALLTQYRVPAASACRDLAHSPWLMQGGSRSEFSTLPPCTLKLPPAEKAPWKLGGEAAMMSAELGVVVVYPTSQGPYWALTEAYATAQKTVPAWNKA